MVTLKKEAVYNRTSNSASNATQPLTTASGSQDRPAHQHMIQAHHSCKSVAEMTDLTLSHSSARYIEAETTLLPPIDYA